MCNFEWLHFREKQGDLKVKILTGFVKILNVKLYCKLTFGENSKFWDFLVSLSNEKFSSRSLIFLGQKKSFMP